VGTEVKTVCDHYDDLALAVSFENVQMRGV
jgi:hypothetical protein